MKKSVCSKVLGILTWSVFLATSVVADPTQPNDRNAILVEWIDYATGEYVETAPFIAEDGTIDGNIEEVVFAVKTDATSPNPVDYRDHKTLHMEVDLFSDAIVPLGLFRSGSVDLKYSNFGNHHFGGGDMKIVMGYQKIFIARHTHNLHRVPRLRAYWQGGGYYLYLQYDKLIGTNGSYPRSNLLQLTISIEGNQRILRDHSGHYGLPFVPDSEIVFEQEEVAIHGRHQDPARITFHRDVWVGNSPVLTEAGAESMFSTLLDRGNPADGAVLAIGDDAHATGYNALAIGDETLATGSNAIAIGEVANALGANSIALGESSFARSTNFTGSIALGNYTEAELGGVAIGSGSRAIGASSFATGGAEAEADYAVALGVDSHADGTASFAAAGGSTGGSYSVALGDRAATSGEHSLALGRHAAASTDRALALGSGAQAQGFGSVAMGWSALSSGVLATSIGVTSDAVGTFSFAAGTAVATHSLSETALGRYNRRSFGDPGNWLPVETLFSLGNGDTEELRSNAITTLKNGRTTLTNRYWLPGAPTDIPGEADASGGEALVVEGHTRLKGKVILEQPQGDVSMGIFGDTQNTP